MIEIHALNVDFSTKKLIQRYSLKNAELRIFKGRDRCGRRKEVRRDVCVQ